MEVSLGMGGKRRLFRQDYRITGFQDEQKGRWIERGKRMVGRFRVRVSQASKPVLRCRKTGKRGILHGVGVV